MSAHRRKSHGMITRLDKSSGFNLSADDCLLENFDQSEKSEVPEVVVKKPKPDENSPVTISFTVPSPTRHAGISFSNTLHRVTVPRPFSFETKDLELRKKREQMVQEAQTRRILLSNSFRARPMRVGSPDPLPEVPSREPVQPEPFNFRTEQRLALHRSRTQNSSLNSERSICKITARSPSVLRRPPFYPKFNPRSPLVPISPELATSQRAVERQHFEEELARRRKIIEEEQQAALQEQMEREKREIKLLRAQLVRKAQPVKTHPPARALPPKPPTVPFSPNLRTQSRVRAQHE